MGALISRWKTKVTTVEQLENLDKEIKELEEFRTKNQRLQKLWVGRLLFYSSVLYLLTSLTVYCCYLPEEWLQKAAMALPFFIYPLLVWFIRKFLIFLFSKRTERNSDKLEELKASKKKILEEVMETETYKNAKLILERFDLDARRKTELEATAARPHMTPRPGQELRQRGAASRPSPMGTPAAMMLTPPPGPRPPPGPGGTPVAPGGPPERASPSSPGPQGPPPRTPCSPVPGVGLHPPGPPLARPILPKDRGALDRVVEYLVGDGPQNRYALICQQCSSHNGMALKEEFEYLAFRCAYCYFLNPARKTRPRAPRLPEFSFERRLRAEDAGPPSGGTTPEQEVLWRSWINGSTDILEEDGASGDQDETKMAADALWSDAGYHDERDGEDVDSQGDAAEGRSEPQQEVDAQEQEVEGPEQEADAVEQEADAPEQEVEAPEQEADAPEQEADSTQRRDETGVPAP